MTMTGLKLLASSTTKAEFAIAAVRAVPCAAAANTTHVRAAASGPRRLSVRGAYEQPQHSGRNHRPPRVPLLYADTQSAVGADRAMRCAWRNARRLRLSATHRHH